MWRTLRGILGCLVLLTPVVAWAAEEAETVSANTIEAGEVARVPGLQPDTALFKEGACSGRWEHLAQNPVIRIPRVPHDWTAYSALQLWLHNERVNGQQIKVLLYSNNPTTEKTDCYGLTMTLDWEGWRLVRLPLYLFRTHYSPLGWHQIDGVVFAGGDFGLEVKPDSVVHIDDLRLVPARPGAPAVLGDLETDAEGWSLEDRSPPRRERDPVQEGEFSLAWPVTLRQGLLTTDGVPRDWTPYSHLEMWVHSARANGQVLKVLAYSVKPGGPQQSCFAQAFTVNWEGWRQVCLELAKFERAYEPTGWNQITRLRFVGSGYGIKPADGTVLHLDGIRLVSGATQPGPAVAVVDPGPPAAPAKPAEAAQPQGTPAAPAAGGATVQPADAGQVLADFERGADGWIGVTAEVRGDTGANCGRVDVGRPFVRCTKVPGDWSTATALELAVRADRATGETVRVLLPSDDPGTAGTDRYSVAFTVTWTGWKRLRWELKDFDQDGKPVGWKHIDNLTIAGERWGKPGAAQLWLDDLALKTR